MTPTRIALCCAIVGVAAGGGWAIAAGSGSGDPKPPAVLTPNGGTSSPLPQRDIAIQPEVQAARERPAPKQPAPAAP